MATTELDADSLDYSDPLRDSAARLADQALTATAFRALPRRWREVLWHVEVGRLSATDTGILMNLQPNAVSALAFRARKGLRAKWVQAHVTVIDNDEHFFTLSNMGKFAQRSCSTPTRFAIENHLRGCPRCSDVLAEVLAIVGRLGEMPNPFSRTRPIV